MSNYGLPHLVGELNPDEVKMYAQTAELAGLLPKPNHDHLAILTKSISHVVH
jgi:hypothetical protein